jgi:signal transduction histidine kinase
VGLYIIKTIVEKNGGNIQVQSALNVGTTFTVLLKPYVVD